MALVTGGGRGIGRAIALGLAARGVAIGLVGRDGGRLEDVAHRARDSGARAAVAVADVRSFSAVTAAVGGVEATLGGIDLLVNAAGIIEAAEVAVWEADPAAWWDVVEVDLRGPFHAARAVVPGMLERGRGRVVSLNSGAGTTDRATYSAYCAAKAGLFRLTGNLHLAGFGRGLRAFEISPGVVRTDMTASMPMHTGRTEWTPVEAVVELVLGVATGDLDGWSGCFLRAGVDTVASLVEAARGLVGPEGAVPAGARRLGILPWGAADPLSPP